MSSTQGRASVAGMEMCCVDSWGWMPASGFSSATDSHPTPKNMPFERQSTRVTGEDRDMKPNRFSQRLDNSDGP